MVFCITAWFAALGPSNLLPQTHAQQSKPPDISFKKPVQTWSVRINAETIAQWQSGSSDVLHLAGGVTIEQGDVKATAAEAILWVQIPETDGPHQSTVTMYLEGDPKIELPTGTIRDKYILEELVTTGTVDLLSGRQIETTDANNELFDRATDYRNARIESAFVRQVQFQDFDGFAAPNQQILVSPQTGQALPAQSILQNNAPTPAPQFGVPFQDNSFPNNSGLPPAGSAFPSSGGAQAPAGSSTRPSPFSSFGDSALSNANGPDQFSVSGRDSQVPPSVRSEINPANPSERVTIYSGGARIQINSTEINRQEFFRNDRNKPLTILADNIVHWRGTTPSGQTTNELYMEGNVVFSKGDRVIESDRMYYSLDRRQGTILNAEIRTSIEGYDGTARVRAAVLQQIDENRFQASGASFTTSQLAFPRYWLQSGTLSLNREPVQKFDRFTGEPLFDPRTGQQEIGEDYFLQAEANRVYVGGVPVFAWPKFETNLSNQNLFLRSFRIGSDSVLGTQIGAGFDLHQLLGRRAPAGTDWIGKVDYLSDRGFALGTELTYNRNSFLGIPGRVRGSYENWYLLDEQGTDFLGQGRNGLIPEESFRGRTVIKHRHDLAPGFVFRGEVGFVSDRNFLEQFFEREWDTQKDATTGLWLERNLGTQSFNLIADIQINDFFTQTSWLPRLDHFVIGQPLANNRIIWHGRSNAGFGRLRVAEPPTDPTDLAQFDPLAGEADVDGFRLHTRQEIEFPVQVGAAKVSPYALGDIGYWQEALDGNDLFRVGGQVGIRGSLPIWKVDPSIQSTLLNVNGLAHKVTFDFDAFYADASQDIEELALFDPLDDDAQEHFRRRFLFNTFGLGVGDDVPLEFDERFFALRSGLQGNVTSPSAEIFDDLAVVKIGARQRWQTKRGAPGQERIIDWITLDTQITYFPRADEDNFGSDFGLFDYDFRWHLGDRFAVVSDGFADLFSQGLRTFSLGVFSQRPELGSIFVGVRSIEGPISSNIITASAQYRLSDKWGLKAGAQLDFGDTGTIGQRLGVVYIGESFLWEVGFNFDASRDNFGVRFGFEPRFAGKSRLFRPGGSAVPAASSRWLE